MNQNREREGMDALVESRKVIHAVVRLPGGHRRWYQMDTKQGARLLVAHAHRLGGHGWVQLRPER